MLERSIHVLPIYLLTATQACLPLVLRSLAGAEARWKPPARSAEYSRHAHPGAFALNRLRSSKTLCIIPRGIQATPLGGRVEVLLEPNSPFLHGVPMAAPLPPPSAVRSRLRSLFATLRLRSAGTPSDGRFLIWPRRTLIASPTPRL